jgi:hypothetical protein
VEACCRADSGERGFDTLLPLSLKSPGMELDGETVKQVLIAAGAVALFIVAAMGLSAAFGSHPDLQNESVQGSIDGTLADGAVSGDTIDGQFNGTLDADLSASIETINGTLTGTVENGNVTGEFVGEATGTVDGTLEGTVSGSYNASSNALKGEFNGTINGTDAGTRITETGGLALVGVLAAFIVLMAIAGLYLERQDFDS